VGGHNRALNRPALSIQLLAVVVLAAVTSLVPSALSGHGAAADAAVPGPRLGSAAADSTPDPQLGASIGSVVSFSRLIAEGLAKPAPKPKPKSEPKPKVEVHEAARMHVARSQPSDATTPASSEPTGYGCGDALAYLRLHAAPGFNFECPGYADGHQAMTCIDISGLCPGTKLIAISTPCAAAYMNEASNSWVLTGQSDAPIDPYGYCHS
jgi:hypothetical protein